MDASVPVGINDNRFPTTWTFQGFVDQRLNQSFNINSQIQMGNRPTFWDKKGDLFMYWQPDERRWVLCPAFDEGEDVLSDVKRGTKRGLAFEEEDVGSWSEYSESAKTWTVRRIQTTVSPDLVKSTEEFPRDEVLTARRRSDAIGSDGLAAVRVRVGGNGAAGEKKRGRILPDTKKILAENPDVAELILLKGKGKAKLLIRFRGAHDAEAAARISKQLLQGCNPKALDPIGAAQFCKLRASCEKTTRKRRRERGEFRGPSPAEPPSPPQ